MTRKAQVLVFPYDSRWGFQMHSKHSQYAQGMHVSDQFSVF